MGAFDYGPYKAVTRAWDDPRLGAACVAIKKELVYNGFGDGLIVENPVLGQAFTNRLNEFKVSVGLTPDGLCGSRVCQELFRARIQAAENKYDLPSGALGKKIKLESAFDPVAIGTADEDDTGICQINIRIHTSVSKEEAFDPEFAIDWAARFVRSNFDTIARKADVMKAARASYNIGPEYATRWMKAGFPTAGGVFDSSGIDWYTRATNYIALIDKQTW
jgi:hypothetical protein